ncbi:MAG: DUF1667 domain-containing protein [Eubacterium sp.]
MLSAMDVIKRIKVEHPVKMGEVIIKDIVGCGVDIIACKTTKVQV